MSNTPFSIRKRLQSFKYAWNGFVLLFREEHNSRIHLVAAVVIVLMGIWLHISSVEWCFLIFSIGLVFGMELLNSALENLADHASRDKNELIGKAKDLSAAAVLVSALTALTIGLIIFIPKILTYIDL